MSVISKVTHKLRMSTSLKPPAAAAAAVGAAAGAVADAAAALTERTSILAGAAATMGARAKRPARIVDRLGMLIMIRLLGCKFVKNDLQQRLALYSIIKIL
jgi:hypothetical protein